MRQSLSIVAAVVFVAANAYAYLATPVEIQQFWDRQRQLRNELYLRYESADETPQILEVFIRPDGLWAKRVNLGGAAQRETWKWGADSWHFREQTWKKAPRKHAGWEDWLFEPKAEILLHLTQQETLSTSGLGLHPEGQLWLYGARHQNQPTAWFGLLRDSIRLGAWHSTNDEIGQIEFRYDPGERYPKEIKFQRQNRPQYQLTRRALIWKPANSRGFQKPASINLDARRLPPRPAPAQHVTSTTSR